MPGGVGPLIVRLLRRRPRLGDALPELLVVDELAETMDSVEPLRA